MDENEEAFDWVLRLALSQYVGEPCRICGSPITWEDLDNGAKFAGYSKNSESRAAHKECWDKNIPEDEWKYQ